MFIELILGVVLLLLAYFLLINRIRGLPPGPPPLPLIGNLLLLSNEVAQDVLRLSKKYGPVFTLWMPEPIVVIADAQILHESIIRGGDTFGDRPQFSNKLKQMADPYGVTWKEQRRFALRTFKEVGFLGAEYRNRISTYAMEVIGDWKKLATRNENINVTENLQSAVSNVMWQLTFGRTLPLHDPFFKLVSEVAHKLSLAIINPCVILSDALPFLAYIDFLLGSPLKRAEKALEEALEITKEEMQRVESSMSLDEPPNCYAAAFLMEINRRQSKGIADGNFNHDQLLLSATSHWFAGIETTVTTLRFAINFLAKNQAVQQKMQAEIDAQIGQQEICMDDQKRLPYCMATIFEIQRIANVGQLNFFRQTSKDTVVGGYTIPAGTAILPQFPSVLMDSEVFANSNEMNPGRFLNEKGEFVKDPRMTPFSMGVRACPGEGLAKMELFLFLTTFMQHLSFSNSTPSSPKIVYGLTKSLEAYDVKITTRY